MREPPGTEAGTQDPSDRQEQRDQSPVHSHDRDHNHPEAYEAILLGTAEAPSPSGQDGLIRVWLDCKFVDRLGQVRSPGESYSDVILRLAEEG